MERRAFNFKKGVQLALARRWCTGSKTASGRVPDQLVESLARLEQIRMLLVGAFAAPLHPVQAEWTEENLKQFCGGLFEKGRPHQWKTSLRLAHAPARVRYVVAGTLFNFRKLLPGGKMPNIEEYISKMSVAGTPVSGSFLEHLRVGASSIFPPGWDSSYWHHVEGFTLPTKSAIGCSRHGGGIRGKFRKLETARERLEVRDWHRRFQRHGVGEIPDVVRCIPVWADKWRMVTPMHRLRCSLLPVHRSMYDAVTRQDWALRGEAVPGSFSGFRGVDGEVFVSGDYASATDNLPIEGSETLLRVALDNARFIPLGVRREAFRSLRSTFVDVDSEDPDLMREIARQERGQLMGVYLSFPLLCAFNYLAFTYFVPRPGVPVKINGDDIAFRATSVEADVWSAGVESVGLTLSKSKTWRSSRFFTLNSRYFKSFADRPPVALPCIRPKPFFCQKEDWESGPVGSWLGACMRSAFEGRGVGRRVVQGAFMTLHYGKWDAFRGSVRRRGQCRVSSWALHWSNRYRKERFYLQLPREFYPDEFVVPLTDVPEGWSRCGSSPEHEKEFFRLMTEQCWDLARRRPPWVDKSYGYSPIPSKFQRMLGARDDGPLPRTKPPRPRFFAPVAKLDDPDFVPGDAPEIVERDLACGVEEVAELLVRQSALSGVDLMDLNRSFFRSLPLRRFTAVPPPDPSGFKTWRVRDGVLQSVLVGARDDF